MLANEKDMTTGHLLGVYVDNLFSDCFAYSDSAGQRWLFVSFIFGSSSPWKMSKILHYRQTKIPSNRQSFPGQ